MYYNRTISPTFSNLLGAKGQLRWLFDFVKDKEDLDFLIGKNNLKEWISIYRGLSRVLSIIKTCDENKIKLDGAEAYKKILPCLYGIKSTSENFSAELKNLVEIVSKDSQFNRYYNNRKEGFYQNMLSRRYGICSDANNEFVIIDKEVVIGYLNQKEKDKQLGPIQLRYKQLQKNVSFLNPKRFGKNLENKTIGNELDFLALDKKGNVLLIEYKHGKNTSGIYLSPLQIGMYYDIFNKLSKKNLEDAIFEMLDQKQNIGLINKNWIRPPALKEIIPVLIISEYNYKSSAKIKFNEVLHFIRNKHEEFLSNLKTCNFTMKNGLSAW